MTNPHKGEVVLKVGDESFILRFSIDAICHFEASTGKSLSILATELAAKPDEMSMTTIRHLLHAGLIDNHPDMSLKQAGELILSAGGMTVVMLKVFEAFAFAFPEAAIKAGGAAEASGTPRPPNRATRRRQKRGTGSAS